MRFCALIFDNAFQSKAVYRRVVYYHPSHAFKLSTCTRIDGEKRQPSHIILNCRPVVYAWHGLSIHAGDYTLECSDCTGEFCTQPALRHNHSRCNHPFNYCRWHDSGQGGSSSGGGSCTGITPNTSSWANCSGFGGLGTFDDLNHLILAQDTWHLKSPPEQSLAFLFARVFGDYFSENYTAFDAQYSEAYWEANLAGTPIYPSGSGAAVRLVLGDFPALFGTASGLKLRRWCERQGWALVWAMGNGGGSNPGGNPEVARGNLRLL